VHAAYPADRRQTLSADPDCRLSVSDRRLWLTDCDTAPASSGGPVFAKSGSGLSLVGIMAAAGNGDYNVAVPATAWRTLLDSATCP
jgi:V8-like Glu-specific endopeptidase